MEDEARCRLPFSHLGTDTSVGDVHGLLLDCGSLLPLSRPQPAVDNHLQLEHRGHKASRISAPTEPASVEAPPKPETTY